MAGASRDLTVNLIGKTDQLTGPFSRLGNFLKGPGGVAAVIGGGVIAAGAALAGLGEKFDSAYDTIRTNTGATGGVLEGLQQSFRDVFTSVPTDMGSAATAISDLNQRLGLTGGPLEALAGQMLNLSRITDTDLGANIEASTRLFGDWGIAGADMAGTMDELFRASQASGVGVDQLANSMVQFGAPLRQMGFGFEESLALFAKFEAEGVNTELVMGSMRIALGRMAKAGESAPDTFRRVVDEIAAMEDPTQATAMAMELFGARAGADMAAAIREGRFEVDEYLATIEGGADTINSAAASTDDWREKLQLFGNKMAVALAPLANTIFDALGKAMEKLGPHIEAFAGFLDDLFAGDWDAVKKGLGDFTKALGELALKGLKALGSAMWQGIQKVWDSTILPFLKSIPGRILDGLGDLGSFLLNKGKDLLGGLWDGVVGVWDDTIYPFFTDLGTTIKDGVGSLLTTLKVKGSSLLSGFWNGMTSIWTMIKDRFANLGSTIAGWVGSLVTTLRVKASSLLSGFWNGMTSIWTMIKDRFANLGSTIAGWVGDVLGTLKSKGGDLVQGLKDGAEDIWESVSSFFSGIPGKILGFFSGINLWSAGWDILSSLWRGAWSAITSLIPPWARSFLGIGGSGPAIPTAGLSPGSGNGGYSKGGGGPGTPQVYHEGGVIPGRPGEERLALVQAGEGVIPFDEMRDGWTGGGGATYYVTINMPPGANGQDVVRALQQEQRRLGVLPFRVARAG